MKTSFCFRTLAALAFATALSSLSAQSVSTNPLTPNATSGLVGSTYIGVGYGLIDFEDSDIDVHALKIDLNQNLGRNADAFLAYEHDRSEEFAGGRVRQNLVALGARGFVDWNGRFRPFVEVGAGWEWLRAPFGVRDSSFLWFAGAGVEIGLGTRWTVAPLVRYYDLRDFPDSDTWNYGVRGSYWLNDRWGVQASATRDDEDNMEYAVGLNFRM